MSTRAPRAGRLRSALTIQSATRSSDGMGGGTDTWATFASVRGAVEPTAGDELDRGQQLTGGRSFTITIRGHVLPTPNMRVLFGARIFEIVAVLTPDEIASERQLICREVPANG